MAVRRVVTAVPRATRAYASLAEDPSIPAPEFSAPAWESVQTTKLSNGVTVVSEDALSPVSSVSVVVGAGSSRETVGGTSALMRAMAFKASKSTTEFRRIRECELKGISLSGAGDRETLSYTATFLRDDTSYAVGMLGDAAVNQAFNSWDVKDTKAFLASVGEEVSSTDYVIDAVHAGAFRSGGHGNSLYVDNFRLPALTSETLSEFASKTFTADAITVVGTDVGHAELVALADEAFGGLATVDAAAPTAKYVGGFETRIPAALGSTKYALGFEGAGRGSSDVATAAVLEKVLFGNGLASIPYGAGNGTNTVTQAVVSAAGSADIESFNFNYNGTGLIGAVVSFGAGSAASTVPGFTSAVKAVLSGGITDGDIARAKAQASAAALEMTSAERAAFYASAATAVSPEAFAASIDAVTADQVKAFAAKVGGSKAVAVAAGDVDAVPYADQL